MGTRWRLIASNEKPTYAKGNGFVVCTGIACCTIYNRLKEPSSLLASVGVMSNAEEVKLISTPRSC